MGFRDWITARLVHFLTRQLARYERHGRNDPEALRKNVRKGDVLLVDGDQRISAIIKYMTQSCWSHAALYVGDEVLRRGGELRARALDQFGKQAEHLIVEALYDGVVLSPLEKYLDLNVRLCRPHRLRADHLDVVLGDAIAAVGWRYDLRNLLGLALHTPLSSFLPGRFQPEQARLGSGDASAVICTSLLGQLFDKVGFPVLPSVTFPEGEAPGVEITRRSWHGLFRRRVRYSGIYRRRHPTLITPRDFDVSPYFEVVKFNVIAQGGFDYQHIRWADDD